MVIELARAHAHTSTMAFDARDVTDRVNGIGGGGWLVGSSVHALLPIIVVFNDGGDVIEMQLSGSLSGGHQ